MVPFNNFLGPRNNGDSTIFAIVKKKRKFSDTSVATCTMLSYSLTFIYGEVTEAKIMQEDRFKFQYRGTSARAHPEQM